ncbi:PREDICTED: protein patched [Drosophila arizonae]|uniref:Protein patched n=1 Tax=Drosophila arizonae TaxID=7263 RepID=A0ABM1PL67_DROAR|nr:PREDICTED: protein patched [Drosophila arizonae]
MDRESLPRVPDTHGDVVDEKLFSDLYIRTSWVDAQVALDQIDKGKARGNRTAIYLRSVFQSHLETLGSSVQKHAGKVLFVAILVLSTFCVGLKSAQIHTKVHQLWIQEGGRLESELAYTQKTIGEDESSTHQLIIQTAHDPNASVLHPQALLSHLEVLVKATAVKVQINDTEWGLRDICNSPTTPSFEGHYYMEHILRHLIPCSIITPLDCFWEGSQLLGPEAPLFIPVLNQRLMWSTLNPSALMQFIKQEISDQKVSFDFETVEQYMKRAAIGTGYMEKPCLNPLHPQCPDTAPNKNSQQPPDVGAILSGGCYGFAPKHMHWPEQLIVGGAQRNRSGHLKTAKALQTVVQLMTEKEMYDQWQGHYKVHTLGWTQQKAAEVLNAWQRNFSREVEQLLRKQSRIAANYDIYVFSSATLDDILAKFSHPSAVSIVIGVAATVLYAFCTLLRWRDPVRGQSSVGVAGVLLMCFSTAAGLGLCALLGIVFNAASTQVVPFLALGLGVDHIFMLTAAYAESNRKEQTKLILKKVGPSILFSACSTAGSFFAAVFIPVPALKVFCLQSAIVMCFNLAAALLVFPAMISLDLRRRTAGRADIFCCCFPVWKEPPKSSPALAMNNNNSMRGGRHPKNCNNNRTGQQQQQQQQQLQQQQQQLAQNPLLESRAPLAGGLASSLPSFSLASFAYKYYTPFLMRSWVKFLAVMGFLCAVIFSLYEATALQDGLDIIDLVPKHSNEHKFLDAQTRLFGFYSMYAVTQGNFEYPTQQKLLCDYHEAFVRVPHVIKNDNGGLPDFWLLLFRDWLKNLQRIFDEELRDGRLNKEKWYPNASSDAILAYKLMVQTGYVDNPVDKSLVETNRLVDRDGIINPKAFYNYLSAWATNDVFGYGASQAKLYPEPRQYYHAPNEYDVKIPKSLPLVYAQMPFYLHGLTDTSEIKTLIGHIRDLSVKFEGYGLPNYPSGIPFIFWEQYMTLRSSLALILACALLAALVLVSLLLLSVSAAILVIVTVLASLAQIFGAMTLLGIKLSAIPAVIVILGVGMILCFNVHISLGFMTSVGNRQRRVHLAMQLSLGPLVHGILTSGMAVFMLSTSPFEFVIRHFCWLLLVVLCVGACNSLIVFPILLSMLGPEAELVPLEHPDRISTPSPVPMRSSKRSNKSFIVNGSRGSSRSNNCHKAHHYHKDVNINDPSLTTITEEPQSWKSSNSSIQMHNDWSAPSTPTPTHNRNHNHNHNHNHLNNHYMNNMNNYQQREPPHGSSSSSGQGNGNGNGSNYSCNAGPPPQPPTYHKVSQPMLGGYAPPELQSIVVQPEVTVETTHSDSNTTKVTATANIKVELVTPGRAVRSYNFTS